MEQSEKVICRYLLDGAESRHFIKYPVGRHLADRKLICRVECEASCCPFAAAGRGVSSTTSVAIFTTLLDHAGRHKLRCEVCKTEYLMLCRWNKWEKSRRSRLAVAHENEGPAAVVHSVSGCKMHRSPSSLWCRNFQSLSPQSMQSRSISERKCVFPPHDRGCAQLRNAAVSFARTKSALSNHSDRYCEDGAETPSQI